MNDIRSVITIPTYKRPEPLRRLLTHLVPEIAKEHVHVILGDNDCSPLTAQIVADFSDALHGRIHHIDVPEPGIANVRNALIRESYASVPEWRWMIMLDDDGYPLPGWYRALTDGAEQWNADLAGGPVHGELPPGASRLARNSFYAGRRRYPTGPVAILNGSQNIIVARHVMDSRPDPWFRPNLGRTGGSDYAFFRDVAPQHPRSIWLDDAAICEYTPAARLTTRALLKRIYINGCTQSITDQPRVGRAGILATALKDTGLLALRTGNGVVRGDLDRLARCALAGATIAGHVAGAFRPQPKDEHDTVAAGHLYHTSSSR